MTTRRVLALAAVASGVLLSLPAGAAPTAEVFVLDGKGYGHGVGMAQDSANAMAAAGLDHEQILQHFYPGTTRARRSSLIRVAVWEAGAPAGEVQLTVPRGAQVGDGSRSVQASGGPLPPVIPSPSPASSPSASPRPTAAGSPPPRSAAPRPSSAAPAPAPATAAPSPSGDAPLTFDSSSPVTVAPLSGGTTTVGATGRSYRGQILAISRSGFRLVDVLDIEDYLRGLGEVPSSWPAAALRTQAVAARTYALRAVGAGHPLGYDVCDDTRCQVFLGVQSESPRSAAAAAYTRGEVVTYRGGLADTFYSANAGGVTATPGEGFGGTSTSPYLPGGVNAPGGVAPWKVTASPADIAARLGYSGRLDAITVAAKGPSGRVTRLRLDGAAGPVELTGVDAARRLGLRSTLFTVTRATGTAQPLPASAAAPVQLAPAQAAVVAAEPSPSPVPAPQIASAAAPVRSKDSVPTWLVGGRAHRARAARDLPRLQHGRAADRQRRARDRQPRRTSG
ncbi:MAG: SpoIID/LytB domain-containing protein [Actinobacteria bacterium]|nr:SpoIID/LytB domain-containing protein [Actinomycetota bacterium]